MDRFGRRFPYLRLSLTDVCNFKCSYCLPNGYQKTACDSFMSIVEIGRLVRAFAGLGVGKIRLTGGEPTIRDDFLEIARVVANTPGICRVAFTTNGYKLPERARDFFAAGLRAVNISIDSLRPSRFKLITGHDRFNEVLNGITACDEAGFETIKVNTVLLKGLNEEELEDFIDFVVDRAITLRFIELMRTQDNAAYFKQHHLSGERVIERLLARGWRERPRAFDAGPAREFEHADSLGTIGLIAPYAPDFCATCNRLRVSAKGALHLCLFGEGGTSLRDLLQHDDQLEALQTRIKNLMQFKKSSHFLQEGNSGATPHLASIGG
ncbi:MAG: GTP 3',8-cyclase MoaA [Gammaproteobacteria bacterium]